MNYVEYYNISMQMSKRQSTEFALEWKQANCTCTVHANILPKSLHVAISTNFSGFQLNAF